MDHRAPGEPLHVLIADGDPDMRFYLRSCLRRLPAHPVLVTEASDDVTGLRVMNAEPHVALLLAEADGRGADGHSLELTLDAANRKRIAVVLVSDSAAVGQWSVERGGAPVRGAVLLGKPFNASQLVDAVTAALGANERTGNILL